jgi:hypothetical protein
MSVCGKLAPHSFSVLVFVDVVTPYNKGLPRTLIVGIGIGHKDLPVFDPILPRKLIADTALAEFQCDLLHLLRLLFYGLEIIGSYRRGV